MAKKILGIEIGNCRLKIAVTSGEILQDMIVAELPENLVRDGEIVSWEAAADFLKETIKENKISGKQAAVVLPESLMYSKRVILPAMTVDQLKVNLPYEFHDYIAEEKEKYVYDYAVVQKMYSEDGKLTEMELLTVAAPRESIEKYSNLCRRAGLKLVRIAPDFAALRNLIRKQEATRSSQGERDYAILDLGHLTCKLYFFQKGEFEVDSVLQGGCGLIDQCIAEAKDVSEHNARLMKEADQDGILSSGICENVYSQIAVEVMRVLNFYNFNHPDNNVDVVYVCGGGAMVRPLKDAIAGACGMELVDLDLLEGIRGNIGNFGGEKEPGEKILLMGMAALGIAME